MTDAQRSRTERDRLAQVILTAMEGPAMAGYRLPSAPWDLAYTAADAVLAEASLAAPAGLREVAAALHEMGLCRTKTTHTLRAHEPDADRLRAALAAAPRSPEPRGIRETTTHVPGDLIRESLHQLPSPETPEAGIDVERLARAMKQLRHDKVSPEMRAQGGWTMLTERDAEAIAAAYARLASREEGERP